jgi:chromosome segregation ATPase
MEALVAAPMAQLLARGRGQLEQLQELKSLRGKNETVILHMMRRVEAEKKEFDASLFKLQGTRSVLTRLSTELYSTLGMDAVQRQADGVRAAMEAARFATGMRPPVRDFFEQARANLAQSSAKLGEITAMMGTMYRKFSTEHGLALAAPVPLSLDHYRGEIDAIEAVYQKQFGTATLLVTSRGTLLQRFFDSIASRVQHTFRAANTEAEAWLKVAMAPLEAQIKQHREQLRGRRASIQRIHDATDSLEQKNQSFEASQGDLDKLKAALAAHAGAVNAALDGHRRELAAA